VKKLFIIAGIVLCLACAGFLYLKKDFLKSRDFKPDNSKAKNLIDLRPSVIAKLQQVVKDGSEGLYILTIGKIDLNVLSSKLDVVDGTISVDTTTLIRLDKLKKLPDDILHIKFHSLHVDGIGITDLLRKNSIEIAGVHFDNPEINIYHKARPYNKEKHQTNDSLTLYQRLMGQMKKIAITAISIDRGKLIVHDMEQHARVTKLNDITIRMNDVRIDSSTQHDSTRFLFAKHAILETNNYLFRTPDS